MVKFSPAFAAIAILGAASASAVEFPKIMNCVDANGNIQGGGTETNTCKNALPKCEELLSKTSGDVKKLLSMKMYGFWKGKDLDLNKTTLEEPYGKDLTQGMCSVVGHHIVYKGDKDLEFDQRRNGDDPVSTGGVNLYSGKSCGARPKMRKGGGRANGKRELAIVFQQEQGERWSSAILGAMPWEIRAAAYQFFSGIGNKPEDIATSLTDESLTSLVDAGKQTQEQLSELLNGLPQESRVFCTDPAYKNLVGRCMGTDTPLAMTDPAVRLCQIVGVTMAMQGGGVQNAIVAQIMANATKNFNSHFGNIMKFDQPIWWELVNECQKRTRNFLGLNRRKKMAKQASCFHDGDWVRVSKDWDVYDSDNSRKRNRKNRMPVAFRLDKDEPTAVRDVDHAHNNSPYEREGDGLKSHKLWWNTRGKGKLTLANGFEGAVEWIIRKKICGQSSVTSPSAACDENVIPDKPAGVKW
jgi:hypothetical protein